MERWYDRSKKLKELMKVLSQMTDREVETISKYLFQVVSIYWKQKKGQEDLISIGRDKLLGYYKAYYRRRWYDRIPSLRSALNIMSTLPSDELDEIVYGFITALKESEMYDLYEAKKQELERQETN